MILNHRFILIALLAALTASLAGCSGDNGDMPEPVSTQKSVTLRLAIEKVAQAASRAEAPDYFEGPEGDFENIQSLRVIIINGTPRDGQSYPVEANKLVRTYAGGTPIDDNLEFKVVTGSKRVYLIANEATLPLPPGSPFSSTTAFLDSYEKGDMFTRTAFRDWIVSLPGGNPNATNGLYSNAPNPTGLPLTEFFDFVVGAQSDDQKYDETQTAHLFLTRAAAKVSFNVEVGADYPAHGVNVTGIRLKGLNWQQWVFPRSAVYNPAKTEEVVTPGKPTSAVEPTDRYLTQFSTPERVNGVTGADVTLALADPIEIVASNKKTVGPLYIPESLMPVALADNPAAMFSVQVELDGNGNWLDAKYLGIGEGNNIQLVNGRAAIARNNHIKVTILFSDEKTITARVQVVPYVSVPLKPWFGLPDED